MARAWPPNSCRSRGRSVSLPTCGQSLQLVEQLLHGQHDRRPFLPLEGGNGIRRRSGQGVPGGPHGPGHAAAHRSVKTVNPPRPRLPRIVPPATDLLDQHACRQRGPADARHLRGRQRGSGRSELGGRRADRLQVSRQAVPRIEHLAERPAERSNLDGVEMQCRQVVAEIRLPRRDVGRANTRFHRIERQPQLVGGLAIIGNHVYQLRPRSGVLAERRQPLRPVIAIGLQVTLVEHDDDRLLGLDGRAKELLHRRVVVLLLGQHGHQHVGRLANRPGALPIHRHVGIHVRRIQQQQPRRHRRAHAPKQAVLRRIVQRIVRRLPGAERKRLEQPLQASPESARSGGTRHTGCLVPAAKRAGGAGHFAGQVVEDHRLADIGAADDGHDQQRRQIELRQQFVPQQLEPLLPRRAAPRPPRPPAAPDAASARLQC